jgi:hypothetical protein
MKARIASFISVIMITVLCNNAYAGTNIIPHPQSAEMSDIVFDK